MFVRYGLILLTVVQFSTTADPCRTPSGQNGDCKVISDCPILNSIFTKTLDEKSATFLRNHHCGFAGRSPKVCCSKSLLPDSDSCGYSLQSKIIGGNVTALDEHPWMALLQYQRKDGTKFFNCGGALISKRYVMTAAHCINKRLISVRLGEHNTVTERDCVRTSLGEDCSLPVQNIPVEEYTAHEEYARNDFNKYNDIALIRLSKEATITDYVRPICLPLSEDEFTKTYLNDKLFIAGWGITENGTTSPLKLKVKVPVREKSFCEQAYRSYNFNLRLADTQICAGGEKGKDSCGGDSGGPLMTIRTDKNRDVQWYAAGLVSFGPMPCGMADWGGVYTRVSKFLPWINSHMKA